MSNSCKVTVLGGGSFGTALCNIIAENGNNAVLWLRDPVRAEEINKEHRNSHYLPDLVLNDKVNATTSLEEAVEGTEVVFVAVPSYSCQEIGAKLSEFISEKSIIVSTTKGTLPDQFKLMSTVLEDALPNNTIAVLSGPNLAKEIVAGQPTATVVASEDNKVIERIQALIQSPTFKVYANNDRFGVELGGTLKNIYAIISGIVEALEFGANTRAMLITRSLAEMSRFAAKLGADPMTFLGLSGVGDLIVTCTSPLSRNFQVGYALGVGKTLEQATQELGQVAEGVNTLKLIYSEAKKHDIYMPLVEGLYTILFTDTSLDQVIARLMDIPQTSDVEFSRMT